MKMKFAYTLLLGACLSLGGALTLDAQNTVPVAISSEVISSNGYSFYAHKVLPRQTLYSISKAYNVTIDQIYAVNEGLKQKGLKANTIILIPKSTPATTQVETAATTSTSTTAMAEPEKEEETLDINSIPFVTHIVKWYEDLTSICEKYDIKEEVVMKFNNLKSRVLASRQQLKIPSDKKDFEAILKAKAIEIVNNVVGEKTPETATTETVGENNATEHNFFNIFKPQNRIRIALFLPFEQNKEKNDYKDFYSGVLLAIHNNPEITIDLDVYDSGTTNLNNVHWDKTDVVIGPVSPQDIEKVLAHASHSTAVISPLDYSAGSLVKSHSNFISLPPDKAQTEKKIAEYLVADYHKGDNVAIICEQGAPLDSVNIFRPLWNAGITPIKFSYNILDGLGMDETMVNNGFKPNAVNRVIINSSNDGFISDAIRNINLLIHNGFNVALYAPNKVRNYGSMDVENFHNTSLQTPCPYYVDYEKAAVKEFVGRYRALFRTEPGSFAFQGYDIASFAIKNISAYGKDSWMEAIENKPQHMLQCIFNLHRNNSSEGWTNYGIHHLCYGADYLIYEK